MRVGHHTAAYILVVDVLLVGVLHRCRIVEVGDDGSVETPHAVDSQTQTLFLISEILSFEHGFVALGVADIAVVGGAHVECQRVAALEKQF